VSQLDLYPTICELLGLTPPALLEGRSLLSGSRRDAVFAEQNYHGRFRPLRSVRTDRYRYVRRIGPAHGLLQYACDGGEAKAWLESHGMDGIPMPDEQLFDVAIDPNESSNVAGEPRYAPVLQEMRGRLDAWMERTADGPIPDPPPAPDWATDAHEGKSSAQEYWQKRREAIQGTHGLRSR
jgi:N-sulfoglucosamine sulfohydrolase